MKIRKNGKVINLTESDLRRIVKKVISEQKISDTVRAEIRNILDGADIDYRTIENLTDADMILEVIFQSIGVVTKGFADDEAPIEAAFMAIEKGGKELYDEVNNLYKKINHTDEDIIDYVKSHIDIRRIWHKKSIANMINANGWDFKSSNAGSLEAYGNELNRSAKNFRRNIEKELSRK